MKFDSYKQYVRAQQNVFICSTTFPHPNNSVKKGGSPEAFTSTAILKKRVAEGISGGQVNNILKTH